MAGATGRLSALALGLTVLLTASADTPVSALAGRYSHAFRNGLVDGSTYRAEDIVEIVPVDRDHAYVRFELSFFNGHTCSLAGVAEARGAVLTYVEPADAADGDAPCTLTIRRQASRLTWNDAGSCRQYCGARGSFLNGDLPWASRRPIRYLARLQASSEYRDALTEWRTGRSVRP